MQSPTSTLPRPAPSAPPVRPAPTVKVTEEWAVIFDGKVDLAITFESEDSVRDYIRQGIEHGQDPERYGIAVRHRVLTYTPWTGVRR